MRTWVLREKLDEKRSLKKGESYLMVRSGYGAGLTPLIDADGKPIVTK